MGLGTFDEKNANYTSDFCELKVTCVLLAERFEIIIVHTSCDRKVACVIPVEAAGKLPRACQVAEELV